MEPLRALAIVLHEYFFFLFSSLTTYSSNFPMAWTCGERNSEQELISSAYSSNGLKHISLSLSSTRWHSHLINKKLTSQISPFPQTVANCPISKFTKKKKVNHLRSFQMYMWTLLQTHRISFQEQG